jgi:hypothetical protein
MNLVATTAENRIAETCVSANAVLFISTNSVFAFQDVDD